MQHRRQGRLHVAGTEPEQPLAIDLAAERVGGPRGTVAGWLRIGMPGEHEPGPRRAEGDLEEEVRAVLVRGDDAALAQPKVTSGLLQDGDDTGLRVPARVTRGADQLRGQSQDGR